MSVSSETIVVDNGSTDGTAETLREIERKPKKVELRVIYNNSYNGLSAATNQAYEISRGSWILLSNPDITFNGSLNEMISFAEANPQFPILAAEMTDVDGETQRVVIRRFPTVARVFFDFAIVGSHVDKYILRHFFRNDYCYANASFPEPAALVDQPGASFLLISRRIIPRIGGIFSNEFPVWWNDVDMARRAEKAGIPRVVLPTVRIVHGLGHSSKRLYKPSQRFMFCQSMMRYAFKWKMHPRTVQFLFLMDAILGILVNFPVWQKRSGVVRAASDSIKFATAQVKGVLMP